MRDARNADDGSDPADESVGHGADPADESNDNGPDAVDESVDGGPDAADTSALLDVEGLKTHYPIHKGWLRREVGRVRAVDGVSFELRRGEALGLVGESGSGKSTLAQTILQLEEATEGEIRFDGDRITDLDGASLREFRRRVQLIVQDPNEAFSPRMKIGEAVAEPLRLHGMDDGDRRRALVADLLERVGLSADDADRYPHEFSGGEKQRIAIARALVVNPDLIIADEPTSALDSRVRADVLGLLDQVRREYDISVLFISHDIDVVRMFCDRLAVMYLGEIVEKGRVEDVLEFPAHPYTRVLLGSVPSLDPSERTLARPLTETIPDPADPPSGCRFHTRCPELVPPDDVDLTPGLWQAVARLRFTLQTGELADERDESDEGEADATQHPDEETSALREQFGLPEAIPDPAVEEAVKETLAIAVAGDVENAADLLEEVGSTVCERDAPVESTCDGRPVYCHRYDPERPGEPQAWSGTE